MRERKQSIFLLALFASVAFLSSSWAAEKVRFAIPSRSVGVMPVIIALKEGFYRDQKALSIRHMGEFLKIQDSDFLGRIYAYHRASLTEAGSISPTLMGQLIEDARRFAKIDRGVKQEEVFDFSLVQKVDEEIQKGGSR